MAFTFFFRDIHTLDLAIRMVVPEVSGRSKIRVWDAGCAMGPEAYTIAILFAEHFGTFSFKNLRIDASDIDEQDVFGKTIRDGYYPYDLLQRIPADIFKRYFVASDKSGTYCVADSLREKIHFHRHDLLSMEPFGDGYTMIICKNVLLHFTHEQRVNVLKMYHRSLMPGGYLVLERTQTLPDEVKYLFEPLSAEAQLFKSVYNN